MQQEIEQPRLGFLYPEVKESVLTSLQSIILIS